MAMSTLAMGCLSRDSAQCSIRWKVPDGKSSVGLCLPLRHEIADVLRRGKGGGIDVVERDRRVGEDITQHPISICFPFPGFFLGNGTPRFFGKPERTPE